MTSVAAALWLLTRLLCARWPQKDNLVEQCLKAMTRKFNENPDVRRSAAQQAHHSTACAGQRRAACCAVLMHMAGLLLICIALEAHNPHRLLAAPCCCRSGCGRSSSGCREETGKRRVRHSTARCRCACWERQAACGRVLRCVGCVPLVGSDALCSLHLRGVAQPVAPSPLKITSTLGRRRGTAACPPLCCCFATSPQSLPKFEHVRMISQTGLLEFKLGDQGALLLLLPPLPLPLPLPLPPPPPPLPLPLPPPLLLSLPPTPLNAALWNGRAIMTALLAVQGQRSQQLLQHAVSHRHAPTCCCCHPAERGRSLFEGVLRNYPKRLDLWSVYLDQEVAAGDQQRIR